MLMKVLGMPLYGTRAAPGKLRIVMSLALLGGVFWLATECFVYLEYFSKRIAFISVWCLGGASILACLALCQAVLENTFKGILHAGLITLGCAAATLVILARVLHLFALT